MGPIQNLSELIAFLTRRLNIIALAAGLGLLVSVYLALTTPPIFQATTSLSARFDTVVDDSMRAGFDNAPARLLQLVEQRLTTRETLLDLANRHDLFPDLRADERIEAMRLSITLLSQTAVTVGFQSDGMIASIIIMARADDGQKAADIANELAGMVLAQTGAGRMARARETLDFLRSEDTRLQQELANIEAEVRQFTSENFEFMPFNAETRRAEMVQINADIAEISRDLAMAQSALTQTPAPTARRLAQLRETIARNSAELSSLQARRDALEPFFMRVAQTERDLAILESREERLRDRVRDMSLQIAQAEGALRLESEDRGAAFEILDVATVPEYAMSRPRRTTVIMGTVAALFFGVIAAFVVELLRPALRSPGQLERECGMRPVIVLPALTLPSERRKTRIAWFAGFCLLTLALAALFLTFYGR